MKLSLSFEALTNFFSKDHKIPSPCGIETFAEGVNPVVDIVAIHGVNGHREETWTVCGNNWLRHFLPLDIPNARIFSWGYNNDDNHTNSKIYPHHLHIHAVNLISDLNLKRKVTSTQERPIIFIAHNLGGMILKEALIKCSLARDDWKFIQVSTYGIFFMGTPHQGESEVCLGKLMPNAATLFQGLGWLQVQLSQYRYISEYIKTKLVFERYPTPIGTYTGGTAMIVPRSSAAPPIWVNTEPIGMNKDHINMVRYPSQEDEGYITMSDHLSLMAIEAPMEISARWAVMIALASFYLE